MRIRVILISRGIPLNNIIQIAGVFVNAFLTDTFNPLPGATGKTHDKRISRQIVKLPPRPIILAGGLKPDNVENAISPVKPAVVDTHTGVVMTNDRKNEKSI